MFAKVHNKQKSTFLAARVDARNIATDCSGAATIAALSCGVTVGTLKFDHLNHDNTGKKASNW